jgi:hypothetical protein
MAKNKQILNSFTSSINAISNEYSSPIRIFVISASDGKKLSFSSINNSVQLTLGSFRLFTGTFSLIWKNLHKCQKEIRWYYCK